MCSYPLINRSDYYHDIFVKWRMNYTESLICWAIANSCCSFWVPFKLLSFHDALYTLKTIDITLSSKLNSYTFVYIERKKIFFLRFVSQQIGSENQFITGHSISLGTSYFSVIILILIFPEYGLSKTISFRIAAEFSEFVDFWFMRCSGFEKMIRSRIYL